MTATSVGHPPQILPGLAPIADRYDAFVLDLWGCVHDGIRPYPGVPEALAAMRAAGKRVLMLSNVPRRVAPVHEMLAGMGIGPDRYDVVLSSGESAWRALKLRPDAAHAALGRVGYHLGPARDVTIFDDGAAIRASVLSAADFLLCTGPQTDLAPLEAHEDLLAASLARGLPMLCANPDLWVMRGDQRLICAGLIAARYRALGGRVLYHGKPHRAVYDAALELLGRPARGRVLCVGDGLLTDIAGAVAAGLDCALIPGGVHGEAHGMAMGAPPDPVRLDAMLDGHAARPTYAIPSLRW
jgi:HAD superfamily hydrolase (TIGR01459 family)